MTIEKTMMVMSKGIQTPTARIRRLGVAEAKSKLSEVLREAAQGPTVIHSRGRDLVVVLAIEDYERLAADRQVPGPRVAEFLLRIEAVKQRHGGGVKDFEPARLDFVPAEPFAPRKKRSR